MMSCRHVRSLLAASVVGLLPLLAGCPTQEPDPDPTPTPTPAPDPVVSVTGTHGVLMGETLQLTASTADGTDASYTWGSSDDAIAAVDSDGLVSGVAVGEVIITVTGDDSGASATHGVVVTPEEVTFDTVVVVSGGFWLEVGDEVALSASTINGTDTSYTWLVDDDSVATIDTAGTLSGVAAGSVIVTATGDDSGESGSIGIVVANEVPYQDEWAGSGHADSSAEAFRHWDGDGEISASCAQCHSTPGYQDYLGADGSAVGTVEAASELGSTVECTACHNPTAAQLDWVEFPSGVVIEDLGPEARCMTCHQGRSSTDDIDQAIVDAAAADDDTVSADLGFSNIHYYAAGATIMANKARGGYQYAGQTYDARFRHVDGADSCVDCHDPHSLEVQVDTCAECHAGVSAPDDAKEIRMQASALVDYDGDGDTSEGIYYELVGVRAVLYAAIQAYGTEIGAPICYDEHSYPYFFGDTNADGTCDASEANYGNAYHSWTGRLLRGAYNYQVAMKDPGAYAHNAKYIIQLLHDSAMDLNGALTTPADLSALARTDGGHFNGAGAAARHWDNDEAVSASCSTCHSGQTGFRFYLEYGVGSSVPEQGNGLECGTCHSTFGADSSADDYYSLVEVSDFALSDGSTHSSDDDAANICATCHAGRKVGADVDASIASGSLSFQNVHYLPAAGTQLGGDGHMGYEYGANAYAGTFDGHNGGDSCTDCHSASDTGHTFDAHVTYDAGNCGPCHNSSSSLGAIKGGSRGDYDGDGTAEDLAVELEGMATAVLTMANANDGLCYDAHSYPYFFTDSDASGPECDGGEASYSNAFSGWTESSLKAAYNYQIWSKDPGAWAHNFDYLAQLLYDAYEDLGGDPVTEGWVRP